MFTHMDVHSVSSQTAVTETDTNCTNSYVRVQDGDDSDAPVVGTYCLTRIPTPITSQVCVYGCHLDRQYSPLM